MTYSYKCEDCSHVSEHGYRKVKFEGRPDADVPLRVSDRDTVMTCPNCGGNAHYCESATIQASGNFTFKADPLDIAIKLGGTAIDINHGGSEARPDRRKTTLGVHRVVVGAPGRAGGYRLPGADGE